MPKTKKDLIYRYADRIGGEHAEKMRAALESPLLKDLKAWNETLTDDEFELQLKKLERGTVKLADLKKWGWPGAPDGSWGSN